MDGVFDFDEVIDRRGTASEKWEKYRGRDILPMWVADMDFRSPPAIIEALHRRTEHGVFGYTGPPPELVAATLSMLERDHGWQVDPGWIVWLPGLVSGLNVTCRAVGEDGDEVLTLTPVYPPFFSAPGNSRRGVVRVPLREENNRWSLDFERLEAAVTPRTRLFMLCNPHNPVGRVFDRADKQCFHPAIRLDIVLAPALCFLFGLCFLFLIVFAQNFRIDEFVTSRDKRLGRLALAETKN